jgi:glc operon protein GlcG
MRCLTSVAGALCVSLMIGSAALAQVPPNPDNPNDTVPDVMAFDIPYGEPINLETAKKVADAAMAEAQKHGNWRQCIAIVGPSGDLVYFVRMDGSMNASPAIAQHKARAAARFRRPTLVFETLMGKGPYFSYLPTLDDVVASRGGNPLIVGGKLIGAVGVSGGAASQDDVVSKAGVAALN